MKLEKIVIPAIIAKNQAELNEKLHTIALFSKLIQLDVMDNQFVPNQSLDFDLKLPKVSAQYEAHLMVADPLEWIHHHGHKVQRILIHYESCTKLDTALDAVHRIGKEAGLVLNPDTSVAVLNDYIDTIEQVLIMTVNPGFYGSPFLPEMLEKIQTLREQYPQLNIEVDGGVTADTIRSLDKAGANMFVSGSFIVKSSHPRQAMQELYHLIGDAKAFLDSDD